MKTEIVFALIAVSALYLPNQSMSVQAQDVPDEYHDVLTLLGKEGDYRARVLKVSIPRDDLKVTVAGVETPTPFGFGGWVAFTKGKGNMHVMMGDLVLLEEEVNPVMSAILDHGLEVTALHNHFFSEEPRVSYMHVHGHGKPIDLARRIKPALDLIGHAKARDAAKHADATVSGPMSSQPLAVQNQLDTAKIARIVGHRGEQIGSVYKITLGRDDVNLKQKGAIINARMGLNTWAAFVGTDESAAVAGDVAMLEDEVNARAQGPP